MADPYDKEATFALCKEVGVTAVRERLLLGKFHVGQKPHAEAWLSLQEASVKDRAEERSEESLSIARKALSNSRLATRVAISAIVLSVAMAIQKIIEWSSK
jgi:hypothetical protein